MRPYWPDCRWEQREREREWTRESEQERKRNWERKWFTLHFTQWHKRRTNRPGSWSWSLPTHQVFFSRQMIDHGGEQTGSNLTLGLLLKWFPPCPADEELTSSGTMAEWEKGRGCHRPSDRHTMVFDQGVVTLSGENLRPGPGSGDRVGPGLQESPYGRVRLGRLALELDTCSQALLYSENQGL